MTSIKNLSANRVAALATWLTALAALILAVAGTFPASWQNAAVAGVALLTKGAVAVKFMDGSQKWDGLMADPATLRPLIAGRMGPPGPPGPMGLMGPSPNPQFGQVVGRAATEPNEGEASP